jgi:branched-chain amino acid transport system ATP-binding protein
MAAVLELRNISKSFDGLRALDQVSFTVTYGESVGLIGPNGSGKSTLFNVIAGALKATSGSVVFLDEDITKLPPHQISRRGIARTFQLVRPFLHLSTIDNVLIGVLFADSSSARRREAVDLAGQILEKVGLSHRAKNLARDLTLIERKWLEVARALAGQPRVLLLDEFMAGLSAAEIPRAVELVRSLSASGITIILVEHIIKAVTATCDRVVVLNAGNKLADGRVSEVVNDPAVIAAYLGARHAGGG